MLLLTPPIPGINVGVNATVQARAGDAFRGRALGATGRWPCSMPHPDEGAAE